MTILEIGFYSPFNWDVLSTGPSGPLDHWTMPQTPGHQDIVRCVLYLPITIDDE